MIARQCDAHLADEFDAAIFRLDRRAPRGADGEDGRVRRIDDGREFAHAVHAEIGDGARAALIFVRPEFLPAGARGEIAHFRGNFGERFGFRVAHDRRDQPAVERDRHADVGMGKAQEPVAREHRIGRRHALQRRRPGLDDEVVERELEGRLAVLAFGRGGIGLLAHGDQAVGVDVGGQIEMRNGLLRLDQTAGDGRAHRIERHFLVSDALIQRLDLRRAGAGCARRRCACRPRLLHVAGDDTAVRPGAGAHCRDRCRVRRPAAAPKASCWRRWRAFAGP